MEHGAPGHLAAIPQPQELEPGGGRNCVDGRPEEAGYDQRDHVGKNLDEDDVGARLTPDPGSLEVRPRAKRQPLGSQLACPERPAGHDEDRDDRHRAAALEVGGQDDQERQRRDDQEDVGEQ